MDYAQEFLEQYRRLEKAIKLKYGYDSNDGGVVRKFCKEQKPPAYLRNELELCIDIRNILAHNPKTGGEAPISPGQGIINTVRKATEWIENPPDVTRVWIGYSNVYAKGLEAKVLPAMKEMAERSFTHIPIVEEGRVAGVFSENTLLSCVLDEEISHYDEKTRFCDISKYLPIEDHASEVFAFASRSTSLQDVKKIFDGALQRGERLGMLFVTQNGKPSEKLLGIVTAWDIAGVDSID